MTKGFTLVELLAVIVILAVLALIATPVVLSIIDDAKESAMLRSAEMYLSGVENAVMRENMNSGGNFRPNECTIANGNMTCGSTTVEVEVDGEVPSTGSITFENGKITSVALNYESGTIVKDETGALVYEGSEGVKILEPGLYDNDGNMIYSWEELTNKEKIFFEVKDILGNATGETVPALIVEDGILSTHIDTMAGAPISNSILNGYLVIDSSIKKINYAFPMCTGLTSIYIPKSVTEITSASFGSCENLTLINYGGTIEEWNKIKLSTEFPAWNTDCLEITVHCTDGDIIIPANK